jgi:hypothetical protein
MVLVFDRDGLRKTGQHVLHQPRFRRGLPAARMSHNYGFAQLRIKNAVGAFNGNEAAIVFRKCGMEWIATLRARELRLRLRSAGSEPPQNIFDWTSDPGAFSQAQKQARFGIGKNDCSSAFKKNEDWQAIENLALRIGVRVFIKIQPDASLESAGTPFV